MSQYFNACLFLVVGVPVMLLCFVLGLLAFFWVIFLVGKVIDG